MENVPAAWRKPNQEARRRCAIKAVTSVIEANNDSKMAAIAEAAAEVIRNQVLSEANNRFSYILQVILTTKFQVELPAQGQMIKRQKTFDPNLITKQYSSIYGLDSLK
jgi:hypothetical protein